MKIMKKVRQGCDKVSELVERVLYYDDLIRGENDDYEISDTKVKTELKANLLRASLELILSQETTLIPKRDKNVDREEDREHRRDPD